MNIFIPFNSEGVGGPTTFVDRFTKKLKEHNFGVSRKFSRDFDVIFVVVSCPLVYLLYAKWKKKKIIQRLDGVYHKATPAKGLYFFYNIKMRIIHNYFADVVVYQSEFSRMSCRKFLGGPRKDWVIIQNGIDVGDAPIMEKNNKDVIKLVTYAMFRRRDQIEPIIKAVEKLDKNFFFLDIYGLCTDNVKKIILESEEAGNIRYCGEYSNGDLQSIISNYDIFLFSDQSACPNSVIEAMAAGIPVVAYNRGSVLEMVESGFNGEIVEVKDGSDPFVDAYPFREQEYSEYADRVRRVTSDINRYSRSAYAVVKEKFDIKEIMQKYENIL